MEADPFHLDSQLFEYVTHRVQHGQAFVAYKLLGSPMVLHSLVDGLPLAALHLRVPDGGRHRDASGARALIARRPDMGDGSFLGVITADNQEFELVMTNLTTDSVLMFDIGGDSRAMEPAFWEHTDKTFWSGRHRNDRRLNRSNILWPMVPNACSENHMHFQEFGEHRRLVLRAKEAAASVASRPSSAAGARGDTPSDEDFDGFPLHVYPKYGSQAAGRFESTSWTCPETIMVVGNPALLDGDFREGHNIQLEAAQRGAATTPFALVEETAASFGVSGERLLRHLNIDLPFLEALPEDMRRDVLAMQLEATDMSALEEEALPTPTSSAAVVATASGGRRRGSSVGASAGANSRAGGNSGSSMGARPAEVSAGRRLVSHGTHSLLIEKFDFAARCAHAVLTLGVRDGLELCAQEDATDQAEAHADLLRRLDRIVFSRTQELMEDAHTNAVYATSECVVCMESTPAPDIVLYQCGHRCVHRSCVEGARLRRCPLCRSPIVALLPCDG